MQQKILCHEGICVDITELSDEEISDYIDLMNRYGDSCEIIET